MRIDWLSLIMFIILPQGLPIYVPSHRNEISLSNINHNNQFVLSADLGIPVQIGHYLIVELQGATIESRGNSLSNVLSSFGIVTSVSNVDDLITNPKPLDDCQMLIIDGSLGSDNGQAVPGSFIKLLVAKDPAILLLGRAAWLLHRFRGQGPPSYTAPAITSLHGTSTYADAVYLTSPVSLTIGSTLTSESGIFLPVDRVQSSFSRVENMTRSNDPAALPALRYDSWPLDIFLYSPEDPQLLTLDGKGLLVNIIAYATSLRELATQHTLSDSQVTRESLLAGGLHYLHEPILDACYYAVHSMHSILDSSTWTDWASNNSGLISGLLSELYIDYGLEAGFCKWSTNPVVDEESTAKGLWLVSKIGLSGQFDIGKLAKYLSSRQSGGFANHITDTYHVAEALSVSNQLSTIDINELELWLRSCVVDASDTGDPEKWGGVAKNPTSADPANSYAAQYVLSLGFLGKTHTDPVKLAQWIHEETSEGDGSFRDKMSITNEELTKGTSSALAALETISKLDAGNRSLGISWLSNNQLECGGFGIGSNTIDIAAKTSETSPVALCLEILQETSGSLTDGIADYIASVKTTLGFEVMEQMPSLMWSHWISRASRFSHSFGSVNSSAIVDYLSLFESGWGQYPQWSNLTVYPAPEYWPDQYRTVSVWAQYFGVSIADLTAAKLSSGMIAATVDYITPCQHFSGHYRPTSFSGIAHMQHSAAAVETLYLISEMDTIQWPSALESAVMSDYDSGTWSSDGWTLRPFAGCQPAIDWLSTRTAFRLDLIDQAMASEIASVINSRVQYDDLWALSRDVATLALLNSSYQVSLDSIDGESVLNALGSTPFPDGWHNGTELWQPVFTAGVLEMISILGLRPRLYDKTGNSIVAIAPETVLLDSDMMLDVTITSSQSLHVVYVHAFEEWLRFDNVTNTDTLTVPVPSRSDLPGLANISVMVADWGTSRGFDLCLTDVHGTMQGSISINTPTVFSGEKINGTTSWSLTGGGDAGLSNISIQLANETHYEQWNYEDYSPFDFSVPTTDFKAGTYNLTINITRFHTEPLVLWDLAMIFEPEYTYISAAILSEGEAGEQISIPWSLHFSSNDSMISGQAVSLEIHDSTDFLVHSNYGTTDFLWTPNARDSYTYNLKFHGNDTLYPSEFSGTIHVCENTELDWVVLEVYNQYTSVDAAVRLTTEQGLPLSDESVTVHITSPAYQTVIDTVFTTNSTGYVTISFTLDENGNYTLYAEYAGFGLLHPSFRGEDIISWSSSSLTVGGLPDDAFVGTGYLLWAQLVDAATQPVSGEIATLRVVFLPDITIMEQSLATNQSGQVSISWTALTAGTYRLEAEYTGSLWREAAMVQKVSELRIPVILTLEIDPDQQVGVASYVTISAEDHTSSPIPDLTLNLVFRDHNGEIILTDSGATDDTGELTFIWIPTVRGLNNITGSSQRQDYFEKRAVTEIVGVSEKPSFVVYFSDEPRAPDEGTLVIEVVDHNSLGVAGATVDINIALDGIIIIDQTNTTDADGTIILNITWSSPGQAIAVVSLPDQGWLLEEYNQTVATVLGQSQISLSLSGQPIDQGSTPGIIATLTDWQGLPLIGSEVIMSVSWTNGTVMISATMTTGMEGKCTLFHTFTNVGDFFVNTSYSGYMLNSSASIMMIQRVYVTPSLLLLHNPTVLLSKQAEVLLGVIDALDQYVSERTLTLTISILGQIVFEAQVQSVESLMSVHWTPDRRGLATISLVHDGDVYYLANSTSSIMSAMEMASGQLLMDPSIIDVSDSTTFTYALTVTSSLSGIVVDFEVLGLDLVPVWTGIAVTNDSGMAVITYMADDTVGPLQVKAGPSFDQFLVGGDIRDTLTIMTDCLIMTGLVPLPAKAGEDVNITIAGADGLSNPIDDLTLKIEVYYLEQRQLLKWTNLVDGLAIVTFHPDDAGSYRVEVSSSGNSYIYGFAIKSDHVIHSQTHLEILVYDSLLEVGDETVVCVLLTNHAGIPLDERTITLTLGPEGPVDKVTNMSGHVTWRTTVMEQGQWQLKARFDAIGVYLSSQIYAEVDVRYGTSIDTQVLTRDGVAGEVPVVISIILKDSGGAVLEGRSIDYEAYHDSLGLLMTGQVIQSGFDAEQLNIILPRMGNYTIVFSYPGSEHYHPSSAAVRGWAIGTSTIVIDGSSSMDRSDSSGIWIELWDEINDTISPILLKSDLILELYGASGLVNLTNQLEWLQQALNLTTITLPVGQYELNVILKPTSVRLGSNSLFQFNITTSSSFTMFSCSLPGLIEEQHIISLWLNDSLAEAIDEADVWIDLTYPDGRKPYGSPYLKQTVNGMIEFQWVPRFIGNYSIVAVFEGDDYTNGTAFTLVVLTRYPTYLQISMNNVTTYPSILIVTGEMNTFAGKIAGATVEMVVIKHNETVYQNTATTSSRGRFELEISGLVAGEYSLVATYAGSDTHAPSSLVISFMVYPVPEILMQLQSESYMGLNTSVSIEIDVEGVDGGWYGILLVQIVSPDETISELQNLTVRSNSIIMVHFIPEFEGIYIMNACLSGIPIIGEFYDHIEILVAYQPIQMQMDVGTITVTGGGLLASLVGLVLWKKKIRILNPLPTEWEASQ